MTPAAQKLLEQTLLKGDAPAAEGEGAGEAWETLVALPRPLSEPHEVKARGAAIGKVVFQVLLAEELAASRNAAAIATREKLKDLDPEDAKAGGPVYLEEYSDQRALHLLSIACRRADDPRFPAFPTAASVRQRMTDDEVSVVLLAYSAFRRLSGPVVVELSPEECEAWRRVLRARGSAARMMLAELSEEAKSDLLLHLVDRLAALEPPAEAPPPTQ